MHNFLNLIDMLMQNRADTKSSTMTKILKKKQKQKKVLQTSH